MERPAPPSRHLRWRDNFVVPRHEARTCPRLEVHREGLDQDIVYLSDQRLN